MAKGSLKGKREELEQALVGAVQPHHRFLLSQHLIHLDFLGEFIEQVSEEIEERLRSFEGEVKRLDTIPGINQRIAQVVLAEVGPDLSRFLTASHLASWAGIYLGNNGSAGKRHSGKTRKGSPCLGTVLIEAAHGAAKSKGAYPSAQFHQLVARRGMKWAGYFDEREWKVVERQLVSRLQYLGYHVTIEPVIAPS